MKSFFKPTKFKIIFTILLIFYVIISMMIVASINTARVSREPNTIYNLATMPAIALGVPFMLSMALLSMTISPSTNSILDVYILISLVIEILFLYSISCGIYWFKNRLFKI